MAELYEDELDTNLPLPIAEAQRQGRRNNSASDPLSLDNVNQQPANKPSIGGFVKDVAGRYANNIRESGLIGGTMKNWAGMSDATVDGMLNVGDKFLGLQKGIAQRGLPLLVGQQGTDAIMGTAEIAGDNLGKMAGDTVSSLKDLTLPSLGGSGGKGEQVIPAAQAATPAAQAEQKKPKKSPANADRAGMPIGLNGTLPPDIRQYNERVPERPNQNILDMETGIDVKNMPGGAFGGIAGLNTAIAQMLPYVEQNNADRAQFDRRMDMRDQQLDLYGTDIGAAQNERSMRLDELKLDALTQKSLAEANKPVIKMQKLPDGREIPLVLNQAGQRLDPNNIDPETGQPMLMMSQTEMRKAADPAIKLILDSKDLSKDAKRSRLELLNQPFIDAGYDALNIDELL